MKISIAVLSSNKSLVVLAILIAFAFASGCSTPITAREQGGLIGAGAGAGLGAIIGSTVGHAAAGALIGGPVGLIAGALIGDQLMGQEKRQQDQANLAEQNEREIQRLRQENARLREPPAER